MRKVMILFVVACSTLILAGCGDVTVNNPPRKTVIVEEKPAPTVVIEKTVVEKPVIVEKTTVEKPLIVIKK